MNSNIETIPVAGLTLQLIWHGNELQNTRIIPEKKEISGIDFLRLQSPQLTKALTEYSQLSWTIIRETKLPFTGQTPFMCSVLNTLRSNVPFGQTITYGELAELSGYPRAARAVGRCMAKNPWPVVIPCHRVVGCNSLGGFSSGPAIKKMLLDLEKQ
ncbi:MAG: methylated-DNA--[protein]-cysteine S-methyltransferase [Thermodesulfobacteriota bacterium]